MEHCNNCSNCYTCFDGNKNIYILKKGENTRKVCCDCLHNDYLLLFTNGWKYDDFEVCQNCNFVVNCLKHNVYIISRSNEEVLWCKSCFDDLWKEAYNDGWDGDDITYEIENEG